MLRTSGLMKLKMVVVENLFEQKQVKRLVPGTIVFRVSEPEAAFVGKEELSPCEITQLSSGPDEH